MDDLRIALLIAGIVVVVVVYAYARHSRRRAARKAEEMELGSLNSRDDWEIVPIDRTSPEPGEARDGTDTGEHDTRDHVDGLGGMFAPTRETPGAELSVDLDILAGLRATYESTIDGTVDESIAPEPSEDGAVEESMVPDPRRTTPRRGLSRASMRVGRSRPPAPSRPSPST